MSPILVDQVNQMNTWRFMGNIGQAHSVTLDQGHSGATFSETTRPIEVKFDMEFLLHMCSS